MFSLTCSGRLAPVITVLTLGFFKHHANANWAIVQPSSLARGSSFFAFAIFSGVRVCSFSHSYPSRVARDPGGTPLLYLPLKRPEASGLHIVVPRPISRYNGKYSFSTLS